MRRPRLSLGVCRSCWRFRGCGLCRCCPLGIRYRRIFSRLRYRFKPTAFSLMCKNMAMGESAVKGNLPVLGVGPIYVVGIFTVTTLATLAGFFLDWFDAGRVSPAWLSAILVAAGGVLIVIAVLVWCLAVFASRMVARVKSGQLMTSGIYAWVRHPVYSAFLLLNTGLLLAMSNWFFLVLPPVYWLALTVLMRLTEERWLLEMFGSEYSQYVTRVNRCLPWPPGWPRLRLRLP